MRKKDSTCLGRLCEGIEAGSYFGDVLCDHDYRSTNSSGTNELQVGSLDLTRTPSLSTALLFAEK